MQKPYSLDYSIERDIDRLVAVQDILDKLEKNPSPTELEQMGSYILYGKDENGLNAYQRGEMIKSTRYSSFLTKEDKNTSLDAILEMPNADQQQFHEMRYRNPYTNPVTQILRPKYNRKTGELIDIGDGDIPGMQELWHCIDKLERWIAVIEGKLPPRESDLLFDNPYRLYRLKHALIDMRRHQYYLKDAYKPTIHFLMADHPKRQYIDWNSDSSYWIAREEWERRVNSTYFPVSKNIEDYETRAEGTEVKWVVRRHTFNWEDPQNIYALICNYQGMKDLFWDKLDTDGHALLMDFERYHSFAHLAPAREFVLQLKMRQWTQPEIKHALQVKFGLKYGNSRLATIIKSEIPTSIANAAQRYHLIISTPADECKCCKRCGRLLPRSTVFFAINNARKDHFSSYCKECERLKRIEKGAQKNYDRRNKETILHQVQTGEAGE